MERPDSLEWADRLTAGRPITSRFTPERRPRIDAFVGYEVSAARPTDGTGQIRRHRNAEEYLPRRLSSASSGFVFGFAFVWYIWWLAILSLLVIFAAVVIRASDDDSDYVMPASEVKAIEDERFAKLARAPRNEMENEPGFAGQPVAEAT